MSLLDDIQEYPDSRRRKLDEEIDKGLTSLEQGEGIDGELFFEELRQKEDALDSPNR